MINLNKIKRFPIYGISYDGSSIFKIGKAKNVTTYISRFGGNITDISNVSIEYNYNVPLNTYTHSDSKQITYSDFYKRLHYITDALHIKIYIK